MKKYSSIIAENVAETNGAESVITFCRMIKEIFGNKELDLVSDNLNVGFLWGTKTNNTVDLTQNPDKYELITNKYRIAEINETDTIKGYISLDLTGTVSYGLLRKDGQIQVGNFSMLNPSDRNSVLRERENKIHIQFNRLINELSRDEIYIFCEIAKTIIEKLPKSEIQFTNYIPPRINPSYNLECSWMTQTKLAVLQEKITELTSTIPNYKSLVEGKLTKTGDKAKLVFTYRHN
jgi:hypothetical protein